MTLNRREFLQLAVGMGASLAWGGLARAGVLLDRLSEFMDDLKLRENLPGHLDDFGQAIGIASESGNRGGSGRQGSNQLRGWQSDFCATVIEAKSHGLHQLQLSIDAQARGTIHARRSWIIRVGFQQ